MNKLNIINDKLNEKKPTNKNREKLRHWECNINYMLHKLNKI